MAAFAYVLLLAIVALGVPLGLSLRARVNDEVRSQAAGQAGLVAATAADLLTVASAGANSRCSRRPPRTRSAVECSSSIAAAACWPTAPFRRSSAPTMQAGRRSPAHCAAGRSRCSARAAPSGSRSSRPPCR